jgi:hypothetical protein
MQNNLTSSPEQMAESPFDPFNFGDDDDDEQLVSPATTSAVKRTNDRSRSGSTSTSRTTNKNRTETAGGDELKVDTTSKSLPPRLNVRFTLHEEVSSSATVDQSSEGGSLSKLSIEGKVMVSKECCEDHTWIISTHKSFLCARYFRLPLFLLLLEGNSRVIRS